MVLPAYPYPMPSHTNGPRVKTQCTPNTASALTANPIENAIENAVRTHTIWKYEKEKSEDNTELFNKLRNLVNKTFDDFEKHADPFNYKKEDFKNKQNTILDIISKLD